MRRNPLKYPRIKLFNKHILNAIRDSGYSIPVAWYKRRRICNTIYFSDLKHYNEESILRFLLHEEAHWTQQIYLDYKETKQVQEAYKRSKLQRKTPFVEWINPFDGGYNMGEWEEKYNHKFVNLRQ